MEIKVLTSFLTMILFVPFLHSGDNSLVDSYVTALSRKDLLSRQVKWYMMKDRYAYCGILTSASVGSCGAPYLAASVAVGWPITGVHVVTSVMAAAVGGCIACGLDRERENLGRNIKGIKEKRDLWRRATAKEKDKLFKAGWSEEEILRLAKKHKLD